MVKVRNFIFFTVILIFKMQRIKILGLFHACKYLKLGQRCMQNNINEFLCKLTHSSSKKLMQLGI